jgi:hypothetical protein
MKPPIAFLTPTSRIPYRQIEPWYGDCVSASAEWNDDVLTGLLALTTCSNQVSLIYSFAAKLDRAEQILASTLRLVAPYSSASGKMRLATASIHQNLARLALATGAIETVSEHIHQMHVGEGFGEDEIHGNFIAWCNAHSVASFGQDAPYFAQHSSKCVSDYAKTIRREAETVFLMRQGQWMEGSSVATREISLSWDRNVVWQLYSLLAEWVQHSAVRREDEVRLIIDEVELEEPKAGVEEISIVRLMLRLCALARLCSQSLFERALDLTERIGVRHGDYYMGRMSAWLQSAHFDSPFHMERAYREALRLDAEQVVRNSTAYEQELLRVERAKLK